MNIQPYTFYPVVIYQLLEVNHESNQHIKGLHMAIKVSYYRLLGKMYDIWGIRFGRKKCLRSSCSEISYISISLTVGACAILKTFNLIIIYSIKAKNGGSLEHR